MMRFTRLSVLAVLALTTACGAKSGLFLGDGAAGSGSGSTGGGAGGSGSGSAGGGAGGSGSGGLACSPGDPPVALATGLTEPNSVVVDETNVYFVAPFAGAVMKVPKAGGEVTTVAGGLTFAGGFNASIVLAIDATHLYVAESGGGRILRLDKDGSNLTTIASGQDHPSAIVIDDSSVYWDNFGDGTIASAPKVGGSVVVLVTGQVSSLSPLAMAASNSALFWFGADGHLRSVAKTGGPVSVVVYRAGVRQIAADASRVFWSDYYQDHTVKSVSFDGSDIEDLAFVADGWPLGIALDGDELYAGFGFSDVGADMIVKGSKSGGPVSVIVEGQRNPEALALDVDCVYWTSVDYLEVETGSVMRAPR